MTEPLTEVIPGPVTQECRERLINSDCASPVTNVEQAFQEISTDGQLLAAHAKEGMPTDERYTQAPANSNGHDNHFQGFQRLRKQGFGVLSGGDWRTPNSHVLLLHMGSQQTAGRWSPNVTGNGTVPAQDRLVRLVRVDHKIWHAGGMDTCGDILAVPAECFTPNLWERIIHVFKGVRLPKCRAKQCSRIVFYDVADPLHPIDLDCPIDRTDRKATAVALARLANGRYLAAVLSKKKLSKKATTKKRKKILQRLDFYLSCSADITAGWNAPLEHPIPSTMFKAYQTINFVTQNDPARTLYLLGLHNTAKAAPLEHGDDEVDLYKMAFAPLAASPTRIDGPELIKVTDTKLLGSNGTACNMDAGAGVYALDNQLVVYAAYHWRCEGLLSFKQF